MVILLINWITSLARLGSDRVSPTEGENRDEESKHYQQDEGYNVVWNRADRLAQYFDHVQGFVFRIIAGQSRGP
mgnify:CR=1 FL=1